MAGQKGAAGDREGRGADPAEVGGGGAVRRSDGGAARGTGARSCLVGTTKELGPSAGLCFSCIGVSVESGGITVTGPTVLLSLLPPAIVGSLLQGALVLGGPRLSQCAQDSPTAPAPLLRSLPPSPWKGFRCPVLPAAQEGPLGPREGH